MTEPPAVASPDAAAPSEFDELASGEQIATPQRRSNATASGRSSPPQAPTQEAWSAPS